MELRISRLVLSLIQVTSKIEIRNLKMEDRNWKGISALDVNCCLCCLTAKDFHYKLQGHTIMIFDSPRVL